MATEEQSAAGVAAGGGEAGGSGGSGTGKSGAGEAVAGEVTRPGDSAAEEIITSCEDGVLTIRLNREARLNAITWDNISTIAGMLGAAASDETVRVAVITGTGRAFCAGGDVKDQKLRTTWPLTEKITRCAPLIESVRAVYEFPKPLIAAINGIAAGAGVGLPLLCDIRYASETARFGFPFVKVGLGPDYGVAYTLPRAVGPGTAARLLYTGAYVDSAEALAIGLVDRVLPPDRLMPAVAELAGEIAAAAPFGVRLAKQSLRRAAHTDFATALTAEMNGQFLGMMTEDHLEGATAFAEKRPPRFTGR